MRLFRLITAVLLIVVYGVSHYTVPPAYAGEKQPLLVLIEGGGVKLLGWDAAGEHNTAMQNARKTLDSLREEYELFGVDIELMKNSDFLEGKAVVIEDYLFDEEQLARIIEEYNKSYSPIVVVGHSLGGAAGYIMGFFGKIDLLVTLDPVSHAKPSSEDGAFSRPPGVFNWLNAYSTAEPPVYVEWLEDRLNGHGRWGKQKYADYNARLGVSHEQALSMLITRVEKGTYSFMDGIKNVFVSAKAYVGEYNEDGKRHGQGTFTYANGDKYVGGWKDGESHGQGTYTYASGSKYVGGYKDGKEHGQGTYAYADRDKYVGGYKDGKEHGQGTYAYANGDKYVGEHKDGESHGQGTYTYASGSKYVGEHKDGKKHGQGTYAYADGNKYVGGWKDGKSHGQGTFTYADADGEKYVGGYKDGKKHGQGTFTYADADGEKYVGGYEDGKKHGQGTYAYADGNKYVGGWKDGKKHGQGTFTWADGDKRVGGYKDGKKHGQATYTWANGYSEKEMWKNGESLK